jgi:hypothetical protein
VPQPSLPTPPLWGEPASRGGENPLRIIMQNVVSAQLPENRGKAIRSPLL